MDSLMGLSWREGGRGAMQNELYENILVPEDEHLHAGQMCSHLESIRSTHSYRCSAGHVMRLAPAQCSNQITP
ncbi:hypothetical protein KIN20_026535 [Parelaphostrongylus tenuis]|uniref:Uncharacterized protein n=1 Tax=Parelaphostrongylus tenuis TaxID=148309 RepID=A0AAD5WD61_PARTN|nr:hypothetical protein KIN20_026535 [Parelaphostrongylus tenuis]